MTRLGDVVVLHRVGVGLVGWWLVGLVVGGSALAGPPWTEPVKLTFPNDSATGCGVMVDTDGRATVAVTAAPTVIPDDPPGPDEDLGRTYVSVRPPGGRFTRRATFGSSCLSMVRSGPRSVFLVLRNGSVIEIASDGKVIRVAAKRGSDTVVGANVQGAAVLASVHRDGRPPHRYRIRVRARARAGRFGSATTLARPFVTPPARVEGYRDPGPRPVDLAVGPRGDMAVLWGRNVTGRGEIVGRIKRPRQRRFGPTIRLGPGVGAGRTGHGFQAIAISSAFSRFGRLHVVWAATREGGGAPYPTVVRAASLPAGSRRFTPAQTLSAKQRPWAPYPVPNSVVVATPDGAVAGWNAFETDDSRPAVVAIAGPSGAFGTPRELGTGGLDGLVMSPRTGTVLATWSEARGILASFRPPSAAFGVPEVVSPEPAYVHAAFNQAGTGLTAVLTHPIPPAELTNTEVLVTDRP